MTSTTSSKNNHFGKLFKWAFVRNNSIMIVFSVLMVVGIVIDLYAITKIATNVNHNMNNAQTINTTIEQGGYISIFIAQIGAILFSLVSATHTFSFLHNKRSTDMFGAIPSTRGTLYFSHLAGGILSVVIPFTVGSLIVTVMTCRSADAVIADLCYIIFGLICIVAVYSFSVLIVYCCGTKLDSNIIILGANAIYIGVITVFWSIASSMIPGNSFEQLFNTPVITLFCPMGFGYFLDFYYFGGQITAYRHQSRNICSRRQFCRHDSSLFPQLRFIYHFCIQLLVYPCGIRFIPDFTSYFLKRLQGKIPFFGYLIYLYNCCCNRLCNSSFNRNGH